MAGRPVRSGVLDPVVLEELRAFRTRIYGCFGPRRDALFELLDAAIASGLVPSLVHLSLEGLYRRRWGSVYAALAAGEAMKNTTIQAIVCVVADSKPIENRYPVKASSTPERP